MILEPGAEGFQGARQLSNNTAELTAMLQALKWLDERAQKKMSICIVYDSKYAAENVQCMSHATTNEELVIEARCWLASVRQTNFVRFEHVKGHCQHKYNEHADQLASRAMDENNRQEAVSE